MARRGGGGGGGMGGGMMAPVLSIATGLIIFVVLIIFAPTIAGSIENAQPAIPKDKETCSTFDWNAPINCTCSNTAQCGANVTGPDPWNTTAYPGIPNGVELWTTNIQILGVVILIISIAVAMYFLKGMA